MFGNVFIDVTEVTVRGAFGEKKFPNHFEANDWIAEQRAKEKVDKPTQDADNDDARG